MTDLSELIERVREATGPDRELDVAVMRAACVWHPAVSYLGWGWDADNVHTEAPPLSSSLDAITALIEQKLPGCGFLMGMGQVRPDEPLGACAIFSDLSGDTALAEAEAPTLPLAACLAFLLALQSQDKDHDQ